MAEGSRTIKLEILGDAKGAQSALKELSGSAEKEGGFIKNSLETAFGFLGGEVLKEKLGEFGKLFGEGIESGTKSVGQFQAKLGLTQQEAQKLSAVSTAVWKDGWGEDLDAVNEALTKTKQQFSNLSDSDLQNLTEQGLILQQTFDSDVTESLRSAKTMADNFGISGSDAMDLITTSFQKGGNKADDLLDTFNEYSVQFKNMGFDAKEFSNVLINGLDKGAFNADKVADAVKEFNIRIHDGSSTTSQALEDLGLNWAKMTSDMADGTLSGKDAMKMVNEALRNTSDELTRNQLGVALYGTQWEDMGKDVILSLDQSTDKIGDFQGATQKAGAAVSQDLGSIWTSFSRSMMANLQPVLSEAINLFMSWVPTIQQVLGQVSTVIQQVFTAAMPYIQSFFGWLGENGPNILNGIGDIFANVILPALASLGQVIINDVWPAVQNLWTAFVNDLLPVLIQIGQWIVENILPAFGQFVGFVVGQVIPTIIQLIAQFVEFLLPVIVNVANWINANLVPAFQALGNFIVTVVIPAFLQAVNFINTNVLPVLQNVANFVSGVFTTVWNTLSTLISTVWNNITGFIRDNWNTINGIFNTIMGIVGGAFSTIWNTLSTLISGVWTAISTAISTAWNTISGIFSVIQSVLSGDFGGAWNTLLGVIQGAWNGIVTQIQNAWNTISGILNGIVTFLGDVLGVAWTGLGKLLEKVWSGIWQTIQDYWNFIRDLFNNIKEFIETIFLGAWTGLQKSIDGVWKNINEGISQFFEGAKRIFNNLIDFFRDLPGNIVKALGDLGGTLLGAGKSLIQGLIDGIKSLHIPMPHINVSWGSIDGPMGVQIPMPKFDVQWYKAGGIFDSPSVIGVGEAGPEAVLPIDKLSGILSDSLKEMGIGSDSGMSEQSLREMMREEMADLLKRSNPTVYQTINGIMPDEVTNQTKKALRQTALEMAFN